MDNSLDTNLHGLYFFGENSGNNSGGSNSNGDLPGGGPNGNLPGGGPNGHPLAGLRTELQEKLDRKDTMESLSEIADNVLKNKPGYDQASPDQIRQAKGKLMMELLEESVDEIKKESNITDRNKVPQYQTLRKQVTAYINKVPK